jgi:hypothetical protein
MGSIRHLAGLAILTFLPISAAAQAQAPVAPTPPAPPGAAGPQYYPAPQGYTAPPGYQSPQGPPVYYGTFEQPVPGEHNTPAEKGAAGDPNLDRSFLIPTAMTQPKGSLTYSNYELGLHGLTYGFTDRFQGSVTILPPYVDDLPLIIALSAKGQVVRAGRIHLALQGSATMGSGGDNSASVFSGGTLFSACTSDDCASLVTLGLTALISSESQDYILAYSGSLTQKISEHAKLLLEAVSAAYHDEDNGYDAAPGFLLNYGIRFHGHNFAGDVGFMRPIGFEDDGDIAMGLPFVNFTYRAN